MLKSLGLNKKILSKLNKKTKKRAREYIKEKSNGPISEALLEKIFNEEEHDN
jgi:hypothetical protein